MWAGRIPRGMQRRKRQPWNLRAMCFWVRQIRERRGSCSPASATAFVSPLTAPNFGLLPLSTWNISKQTHASLFLSRPTSHTPDSTENTKALQAQVRAALALPTAKMAGTGLVAAAALRALARRVQAAAQVSTGPAAPASARARVPAAARVVPGHTATAAAVSAQAIAMRAWQSECHRRNWCP